MTVKDPFANDNVQTPASEPVNTNGKPARNYKNLALGGGWLFSMISTPVEKKAKIPEVEKVNAKISNELIDAAESGKKEKNITIPVPLGELKSPESASNSALNLEEKEKTRQLQIIGSSMDASGSEFSIRSSSGNSGISRITAAESQRLDALKEQKDLQNRLLANSEKIVNAGLSSGTATSPSNLTADQAFLAAREKDSFEAPIQIHDKHRGHALYQGHLIRTVLLKGINSDIPGDILARVVSDVFDSVDGRILLIPKGTIIYGAYSPNVAIGQSRLQVATDRMIFPNGTSASLQKSSVSSMTGYGGLDSKVDNHFFQMFGTSLLVGAASWLMPAADQATTTTTGAAGVTTGGSLMAQAVGGAMKDIGSRNKNIKQTLTVGQGEMFLIEIGRDVVLPEYIK
jgi:type IV secretion system protein TrbI